MLNHQLIKVDGQGRLRTTLDTPLPGFNGGTPTRDGLLSITLRDGQFFINGLGYIVSEQSITAEQLVNPEPGGGFVNAQGRLRAVTEAPMFWLYGLPFAKDGQLSIAPPEVVGSPDTRAFSSAFSTAFD